MYAKYAIYKLFKICAFFRFIIIIYKYILCLCNFYYLTLYLNILYFIIIITASSTLDPLFINYFCNR